MYAINGSFLSRKINGQIRVAIETIKELDKLVLPNQIYIVAPKSEYSIEGLKNIEIIRYGSGNAKVWEQTYFFYYILKNHLKSINFLNSHPLLRPDICYIHDVLFSAYPNLYKSFYGKMQKRYVKLMIFSSVLFGKRIITVSNFSKDEICKYYRVDSRKISVIYNGYQHMNSVEEDETVFMRMPEIKKGEYFLAASGRTPQKNFEWVVNNAQYNKDKKYVIAGKKEGATRDSGSDCDNLIFLEEVSDGELKALMHNCKAFIHPAIYEGFGMTPLEAAASGCKNLILSRIDCLLEIYGEYAFYINPYDSEISIDDLIKSGTKDIDSLLLRYNWATSAKMIFSILFP